MFSKEYRVSTLRPEELEKLKQKNIEQWQRQADKATRFCKHCKVPIDEMPGDDKQVPFFDRCTCCQAMESAIQQSAYFLKLIREEQFKRKEMGL